MLLAGPRLGALAVHIITLLPGLFSFLRAIVAVKWIILSLLFSLSLACDAGLSQPQSAAGALKLG